MDLGFRMHAERTPNPDSVKWVLSRAVAGGPDGPGTASFEGPVDPEVSPLAARVSAVEGVEGVFLGPDFLTVTKSAQREWTELAQPIVDGIKAWVEADEPALGPAYEAPDPGEQGEVVARIRQILERDIQPYIESDGGEIAFAGFQAGVVEVYLRGACHGCPSSTVTLKMGIEARLKEEIPEVTGVVAL